MKQSSKLARFLFPLILLSAFSPAFGATITFTQGDTPTLQLTAETGTGDEMDLTGATFVTQFKGPVGALVTIPNSQHTANPDQDAYRGQFSIAVQASQGLLVAPGSSKDIVTKVVQGSTVTYLHGNGILQVLPNVPLQ